MTVAAYYNEIDPYCADWLRNLIKDGHIADGDVDTRSIEDVLPSDLAAYTQCHFFAGIGVWSYALRLAGWPDERPVWTGSCPCQPFSAAGKGAGFDDERHLWPAWHHLIREQRPGVVFGEQVASRDGLGWLDLVQADMEGEGYASGAIDLCAAGVGAPHIRQRLYFVAHADRQRREWFDPLLLRMEGGRIARDLNEAAGRGKARGLANAGGKRRQQVGRSTSRDEVANGRQPNSDHVATSDGTAGVAQGDASGKGLALGSFKAIGGGAIRFEGAAIGAAELVRGFWTGAEWIFCRDPGGHKLRPVEPGTFPLAPSAPGRVGKVRAYGNAINAEAARTFVEAYLAGVSMKVERAA